VAPYKTKARGGFLGLSFIRGQVFSFMSAQICLGKIATTLHSTVGHRIKNSIKMYKVWEQRIEVKREESIICARVV